MHGRKMGEMMGKWAASGEGSWREEKIAARLLVGERKEKKRKGKWGGLLHWVSVWVKKWRWEVGQVGLEFG